VHCGGDEELGIGAELDRTEAFMSAGQSLEAVAILTIFVARKPNEARAQCNGR
jgi:hypothetical protein